MSYDNENKIMSAIDVMKNAQGIMELSGNPETEKYLLIAVLMDDNDEYVEWYEITGRNAIYNFIKENVETDDAIICPGNSFVYGENDTYNTRKSVVVFMDTLSKTIYHDDFNIYDYTVISE